MKLTNNSSFKISDLGNVKDTINIDKQSKKILNKKMDKLIVDIQDYFKT